MAEHTPGPWSVEEYGDDDYPNLVIHRDTETRVCFMATPGSHGDPARIEADARLIAAAPDMLEALTRSLNWLCSYPGGGTLRPGGPVEQARGAIAKAIGDDQ